MAKIKQDPTKTEEPIVNNPQDTENFVQDNNIPMARPAEPAVEPALEQDIEQVTEETKPALEITKQQAEEKRRLAEIARNSGFDLNDPKQKYKAVQLLVNEKAVEEAQQINLQQNEIEENKNKLYDNIEDYTNQKQLAQEKPHLFPDFKIDPEFEAIIQAAQEQQVAQEIDPTAPTEEDVKNEQQAIKKNTAQQIAAEREQVDILDQLQNDRERIQKNYDNLQDEITRSQEEFNKLPQENAFQKASTGNKILAVIGAALGGIGQGLAGGSNTAMDMINKIIDQDFENQRFNQEQKNKKLNYALNLYDRQLRNIEKSTQNAFTIEKIKTMRAQAQKGILDNIKQQIKAKGLADPRGVTRIELESTYSKDRDRAVKFPDGNYRFASSAKRVNQLQKDMPALEQTITGVDRLIEILDSNEGILPKEISPTARAEAKALQKSLVGLNRIALFGGGPLTEAEQKLASDIIADPTKIFQLDVSARASLKVVRQKAREGLKTRLRNAGIEMDQLNAERINEANLKTLTDKGLSRNKAMTVLIKNNAWKDDLSLLGFK